MNRLILHSIIEHIKGKGEFPFDVEDVDQDVQNILCFFNILDPFDKDDTELLREALRKMALEEEEAEAVRLAVEAGWVNEVDIAPAKKEQEEAESE
jgi:hypothetical protein